MTTHQAIDIKVRELEDKILKLKIRKANTFPELTVKKCQRCGTMNDHYNVDNGNYTCAFC